jgi:hypothetical protein
LNKKLNASEGMPAIIVSNPDGTVYLEEFFCEGRRHNLDDAAVIKYHDNGKRAKEVFFIRGAKHNLNGPAVVLYRPDGTVEHKEFWVNGEKVTEQNLAVLTDKRREYLSDDKAIARGGARGMLAVTQSQQAEEELQTLANRYYGSSVGSMLVSGGVAMTDEGIAKAKEEFGNLTTEQKDKIAARLKAEGVDVGDSANLTEANYRNYISLQAKDAKDTMTSAHKTMGGAADQTYANLLKPTEAVQEKANKLFDGTATDEQASGLQALESAASLSDVKLDESGLDIKDLSARLEAGEKIDTIQMSP